MIDLLLLNFLCSTLHIKIKFLTFAQNNTFNYMSCLTITPRIKELAKKFPNETEQSVLNLVGMWQEKNSKSIEDIPSGSELNDFIKKLRGGEAVQQLLHF